MTGVLASTIGAEVRRHEMHVNCFYFHDCLCDLNHRSAFARRLHLA